MDRSPRPSIEKTSLAIRLASQVTGLSAHTLRVWERRYGFPAPVRTADGVRLYSPEDLARLKLVAEAVRLGFRPREVIDKSVEELHAVVRNVAGGSRTLERSPWNDGAAVLEALLADDTETVKLVLRRAAVTMGARAFVTDLVQPLLVRVGRLWETGRLDVRHEHFASECVSTQLRVLLAQYDDIARGPTVVLGALPGETHVLSLPMVGVYLATHGLRPILLGPNTPPGDLAAAASALHAEIVGVSVTCAPDPSSVEQDLDALGQALPPGVALWVGGRAARTLSLPHRAARVVSWADLDRALLAHGARPPAKRGTSRAVDAVRT